MKLFVFDMAGTTEFDKKNVGNALLSALKGYGFDFSIAEINKVMGFEKPVAIKVLLERQNIEYNEETVNQIHEAFVADMIMYYQTSEEVKPTENVMETFDYLRGKGIKVGFDTGFSRPIANAIVERWGWIRGTHYECSNTCDEGERGRPYRDMIHKAMQLFYITDSKGVAKVGDTISDFGQGVNGSCGLV